jgi:hypothetical protein
MDSFSIFVLCVLVIMAISGMHRRHTRARIIREMRDDNATGDEIAKVLKAYKESE